MPVNVRSLHDTWSILLGSDRPAAPDFAGLATLSNEGTGARSLSRAVGQVLAEGRVADQMRQMYPASSEARKATAAAISTGSGNQPRAGWVLLDRQRSGSEC
jgi:hypothetical protein